MKQRGTRTMWMSVIMSAPGPLILAVGLTHGRSHTQIADFIRRSIELLALIVSLIAYQMILKRQSRELEKSKIERSASLFTGTVMIVTCILMLFITLFDRSQSSGNVIYSLVIAILGVIANTIFWFRYQRLAKIEQSAILSTQSKLYRAKSLVDICVTIALLSVMINPSSSISYYLDLIGSCVVSVYLGYSGIKIIRELRNKPTTHSLS